MKIEILMQQVELEIEKQIRFVLEAGMHPFPQLQVFEFFLPHEYTIIFAMLLPRTLSLSPQDFSVSQPPLVFPPFTSDQPAP